LLQTLNAKYPISLVAFNPGKHQIVGTDSYGQVEVWDGAGKAPKTLGKPSSFLNDVRFNQSGSEFVTTSASGTVNVWNARDDRLLNPIDACPSPNQAAFSHDGSKIVVACLVRQPHLGL
jgi:WD40 repeat protein